MMIALFAQLSDTLWFRVYPRTGEQKVFRGVESSSGLITVGYTTENGDKDFFIAEVDTIGNLLWATVHGQSGVDEVARDVAKVSDGYIVVGWRGPVGNRDIHVVKVDTFGNVVWDTTYGVAGEEEGLYGAVYDTLRGIVWGVGFKRFSWDTSYVGYVIGIDPIGGDSVKALTVQGFGYREIVLYSSEVLEDGRLVIGGKGILFGDTVPNFFPISAHSNVSVSGIDSIVFHADTYSPGLKFGVITVVGRKASYPFYFVSGSVQVDNVSSISHLGYLVSSLMITTDSNLDYGILSMQQESDTFFVLAGFCGRLRGYVNYLGQYVYVYDPSDKTKPYSPIVDTVGELSSKIQIAYFVTGSSDLILFGPYYDFSRTDVGSGARFIEGDSLDLLITGYSNSFSTDTSDYDLIALRVRPERVGIAEMPKHEAIVEGVVRIYDASGRLVYVGEYDRARLGRGVFFVVGKDGVRRIVRSKH